MRKKEKTKVELKITLNYGDCDLGRMSKYGICKMILGRGMSALDSYPFFMTWQAI